MEQVLELKHIHYAYHNLEGETPEQRGVCIHSRTFRLWQIYTSFSDRRVDHSGKRPDKN